MEDNNMNGKSAYKYLDDNLNCIKKEGLWKGERIIESSQKSWIEVEGGRKVLNMCSNNYLGLSDHPDIKKAASKSYDSYGYGMSSVRFICGTQTIHKQLEGKLSKFLETEDTILYSSCFDANGGLFETLLTNEDAIISDELNHASIIDGIRLCKAKRFVYKNNNMEDLGQKLIEAQNSRIRLIATDGVFSMDGTIANLNEICRLADKYDALVMVDDSHAVGFMGKTGKGTHEYCDVLGKVDIITGTLGKALGGASGGYTSGSKTITDLLRQRSRPYLFSNTLAPSITAASCRVLDMISEDTRYRDKLESNTVYFRKGMKEAGFDIAEGAHPIIPVMLYDEKTAVTMAQAVYEKGVYVVGFSYPVVPKGRARIRTQVSAAHSKEDLDFAISAFEKLQSAF
jgi:glycine C-acetyltransferase